MVSEGLVVQLGGDRFFNCFVPEFGMEVQVQVGAQGQGPGLGRRWACL
jgi:hypothetical protein